MSKTELRGSFSAEPFFFNRSEANNIDEQFHTNLQLYDYIVSLTENHNNPRIICRISTITNMHRIAFNNLSRYAGVFRISKVEITGSRHFPPPVEKIAVLVEDMNEYLLFNWDRASGVHLAAYSLWRLLWIHPFAEGNGVVARAFSYGVVCAKVGFMMPGEPTLPEQIAADRTAYYDALGAADQNWAEGRLDLGELESFIRNALNRQVAGQIEIG